MVLDMLQQRIATNYIQNQRSLQSKAISNKQDPDHKVSGFTFQVSRGG